MIFFVRVVRAGKDEAYVKKINIGKMNPALEAAYSVQPHAVSTRLSRMCRIHGDRLFAPAAPRALVGIRDGNRFGGPSQTSQRSWS